MSRQFLLASVRSDSQNKQQQIRLTEQKSVNQGRVCRLLFSDSKTALDTVWVAVDTVEDAVDTVCCVQSGMNSFHYLRRANTQRFLSLNSFSIRVGC